MTWVNEPWFFSPWKTNEVCLQVPTLHGQVASRCLLWPCWEHRPFDMCCSQWLTYCGWAVAKSDKPPILDGWNPISNGMFTTYQLVIGISQPSTVSLWWSVEHSYFWLQSADWWFGTFLSFFQSVGNVIIPTDFHSIIFQKGWNDQPDIYIYIKHNYGKSPF